MAEDLDPSIDDSKRKSQVLSMYLPLKGFRP